MLSKTWRVYRIFTNKRMKLKMSIRDKHLLVIIGILVSMETLVLIVWEGYSPHRVDKQMLKTDNVTKDSGDTIAAFYLVCVSDYSSYFNWTLHTVNGALIAFGAFLAWETRRVHIDNLNDSKTIGICLYNVVVLSVVGLVLSLILKDKPIELLGVTSCVPFRRNSRFGGVDIFPKDVSCLPEIYSNHKQYLKRSRIVHITFV
ncbi:gamma-aminobutyric acid type B receptor subunit 2-like [Dreissena polymorpha]|nr:gamma-aminobutyric acid type B receptor subunit 2-like [Dreissena polymorpha]